MPATPFAAVTTGLPESKSNKQEREMTRVRNPAKAKTMPTEEWLEIRDSLTLALDGIETGPLDFIGLR